jgi:hypothetical protein
MTKSRTSLRQQATDLRRNRIIELLSTGHITPRQISERLNIPLNTVYRDLDLWTRTNTEETQNHFKSLALELKKCYTGIDMTIRETTNILESNDPAQLARIPALNARMQAYKFKMELLDGKAQLKQVFGMMNKDRDKNTTVTRVSTPQNTKVLIDGTP